MKKLLIILIVSIFFSSCTNYIGVKTTGKTCGAWYPRKFNK